MYQHVTRFPLPSDSDEIDYVLAPYGGYPLQQTEDAKDCGAMMNDNGFYHWRKLLDELPDNVYDVARAIMDTARRYTNHSNRDNNCMFYGRYVVALRRIERGRELTVSYGADYWRKRLPLMVWRSRLSISSKLMVLYSCEELEYVLTGEYPFRMGELPHLSDILVSIQDENLQSVMLHCMGIAGRLKHAGRRMSPSWFHRMEVSLTLYLLRRTLGEEK